MLVTARSGISICRTYDTHDTQDTTVFRRTRTYRTCPIGYSNIVRSALVGNAILVPGVRLTQARLGLSTQPGEDG